MYAIYRRRFDLYPLKHQLPKVTEHDLKDIPEYGVNITRLKHIVPTMEWVEENDQWKPLVQSYLACVSFIIRLGNYSMLLRPVPTKATPTWLSTPTMVFIWAKRSASMCGLWEDGTRTAMIIAGPHS